METGRGEIRFSWGPWAELDTAHSGEMMTDPDVGEVFDGDLDLDGAFHDHPGAL